MASTRSWRRRHQVRSVADRARWAVSRRLDEGRCSVVDQHGVRCPELAVDMGYCAMHWGH